MHYVYSELHQTDMYYQTLIHRLFKTAISDYDDHNFFSHTVHILDAH